MPNVTFLEPGTDATQDTSFFVNVNVSGTGSVASSTEHPHAGKRTLKVVLVDGANTGFAATPVGVAADTGTSISFWLMISAIPTVHPTSILEVQGSGFYVLFLGIDTAGKLDLQNYGTAGSEGTAVHGSTVLKPLIAYHVTLSYVITTATNWTAKVYLNGSLEITSTNAQGTINTASNQVRFGNTTLGTEFGSTDPMSLWYDSLYIDDRTDNSYPGRIDVTAKRPNANGTTNGFTTQIGAGGSGYGTGHSPQVNEQPLSTTNGWSMVGAGSAVTEEYNAEGASVGDINIAGEAIVGVRGWVYASSVLSETGNIIVDGTSTNISLTNVNTMFTQNSATPTVLPAGTGTDIGIITATTVTTVSLYECGILIAFMQTYYPQPAQFRLPNHYFPTILPIPGIKG